MIPADERLESHEGAAFGVEDRLIDHGEFVVVERFTQRPLHVDPAVRLGPHRGVECLDPVAPVLLRPVHREVRITDHGFSVLTVLVGAADPDRGRDVDLLTAEVERFLQRLQDPRGNLLGDVGSFQSLTEDDELVATEAGDRIDRAQRVLDPARGVDQ